MKKKVDKHNPFAALQNVKLPEDAKKAPPPPPKPPAPPPKPTSDNPY